MRFILLALAVLVLVLLFLPRELAATRTVGDQGRAERLRVATPRVEGDAPRMCTDGETPSDRDPCVPPGAQFAPSQ
jgi:hypothetical protein